MYTAVVKEAQKEENIKYLNAKLPEPKKQKLDHMECRYIKREGNRQMLLHDTKRAVQNEFLTIHERDCCLSSCIQCGIDKRLMMGNTCAIESATTKYVTYKKYVKASRINTEGNLAKSSILTLTKTTASYMAFFNDFMKK